MKVLITGASGMLGSQIEREVNARNWKAYGYSHHKDPTHFELDVTKFDDIRHTITNLRPDVIVHCAALTDVDYCHNHPDESNKVNYLATKNLATTCEENRIHFVFISTGQVFDGQKQSPYLETDQRGPLNAYARAKVFAENEVMRNPANLILRSGWLFGGGLGIDKKFVPKILNQIKSGTKEFKAVGDYFGSPTYTPDLADAIVSLISNEARGVYHVVNTGMASRYDMTKMILGSLSNSSKVIQVNESEFGPRAPHPVMEALSPARVNLEHKIKLRPWENALQEYVQQIW